MGKVILSIVIERGDKSTIVAFQFEVERGKREETQSFTNFDYDMDSESLKFTVNRELL